MNGDLARSLWQVFSKRLGNGCLNRLSCATFQVLKSLGHTWGSAAWWPPGWGILCCGGQWWEARSGTVPWLTLFGSRKSDFRVGAGDRHLG